MIRVVLDTNIVISGLLWSGTPKRILGAAAAGTILPLTTEILIDELREVLGRPKFTARIQALGTQPDLIIETYLQFASIVEPAIIAPAIAADPDDDAVLACAVGGNANFIASGDQHLLAITSYQNIPILTAEGFILRITSEN